MVWRSVPKSGYRGWTGPGTVVCVSATRNSVWVAMKAALMKCSAEQVRPATDEEYLGSEISKLLGREMLERVQRTGQRGFVDVQSEGPPDDALEALERLHEDAEPREDRHSGMPTIPEENVPIAGEEAANIMEAIARQSSASQPEQEPPRDEAASSSASSSAQRRPREDSDFAEVQPAAVRSRLDPEVIRQAEASARRLDGLPPAAVPPGGWTGAGDRARRSSPYGEGAGGGGPSSDRSYVGVFFDETDDDTQDYQYDRTAPSRTWWVTRKPRAAADSVVFSKLRPQERKQFEAARKKEIDNLLRLGAFRVMSMEESRQFENHDPEAVIDSNFVEKWKSQDDGSKIAKSRFITLGWQDPDVYKLERAAPTPTAEGITVMFQWMASRKVEARCADLRNAFAQSRPTTRTRKLAVRQPRSGPLPGLMPGQLLMCETEVYGLVSGPSWLRSSLREEIVKIGYVQNPYDKCIYTLKGKSDDGMTEGNVLLDVDDFVEGGTGVHRKNMQAIYEKYEFGKSLDIRELGDAGTLFAGRRVKQRKDYVLVRAGHGRVRERSPAPDRGPEGFHRRGRAPGRRDAESRAWRSRRHRMAGEHLSTRPGSSRQHHPGWLQGSCRTRDQRCQPRREDREGDHGDHQDLVDTAGTSPVGGHLRLLLRHVACTTASARMADRSLDPGVERR